MSQAPECFSPGYWPIVRELDRDERTITRPPIDENTTIVRYVGLSTLLHYLSGRAFIPSLRLLRLSDAWEGLLFPGKGTPKFNKILNRHLVRYEDFFLDKFEYPVYATPAGVNHVEFQEDVKFQSRYRCWLDELAAR